MKKLLIFLAILYFARTEAQVFELKTLSLHGDDVAAVAYSPDGKYLASCGNDNIIMVWDANNYKLIEKLTGHSSDVTAIEFTRDGKYLYSSDWDKKLIIWKTKNWKKEKCYENLNESVNSLIISPDGKYITILTTDGGLYFNKLSDINITRATFKFASNLWQADYSPDGLYLATGGSDNLIKIFNTETGKKIKVLNGGNSTVCAVNFSPDGKFLASAGYDKTIKIWNTDNWTLKTEIEAAHTANIWTIKFSPAGNYLASGSYDSKVKVWSCSDWKCVSTLIHTNAVTDIDFNVDGTEMASSSWDNTVKIWNVSALAPTKPLIIVENIEEVDVVVDDEEYRVGLVIGNSDYEGIARLENPSNDADSIANVLTELKFDVTIIKNATLREMDDAVYSFGEKIRAAKARGLRVSSTFYYSGHGLQIKGNNYLIPIGETIREEADVPYAALNTDKIMAKINAAGSETNIIILDTCRNNPFEKSLPKFRELFPTYSPGLAQPNLNARGILIAYSTSPGSVAIDGDGANSPYAVELMKALRTENISIEEMFKNVRIGVLNRTKEIQLPWEANALIENYYYNKKTK